MMNLPGSPACGYARASSDPAARTSQAGRSVESQDAEIRLCGDELGVRLLEVYCDNNLPASERATKVRDDWVRLNADIAAGRYKVLILWDCSRGSRELLEWVTFLKMLRDKGVLVHLITHGRTYDPKNNRDWKILVQEGVEANSQSNMISDNVKRGNKRARQKGRPHGHAPFGWRRVYDPESGKMVTQEPVPEEQPQLTEMYAMLISGMTRTGIARELNRRVQLPEGDPDKALPTRNGNLWQGDPIATLLKSPTHIGKIRDPESGELVDGNWEGTVPEDLWWAAQAVLSPRGSRSNARKHLLTGIAKCGVCTSVMGVGGRPERRGIHCAGKDERGAYDGRGMGHVTIRMDWADEFVIDFVLRRMADPDFMKSLVKDDSAERAAAGAEAKRMKAEIDEMWAKVEAREPGYRHDRVAALEATWEPEIRRLEEESAAGLDSGRARALEFARMAEESGAEGDELLAILRDGWDDTPLRGRRELVRIFTESITIKPRQNRGRKFDPNRIVIK